MQSLYLVSTELRQPFEPRLCHITRRIRSELRDDLAVVEINPPLPPDVYDTPDSLGWLVLATRHAGSSLFSDIFAPVAVYICRLKHGTGPSSDVVASKDLVILDWGEARPAA